ncbi:MAG: signal peptidase II [Pseudomonadota bacterium]|nr:signal peptidase II [Pseudomonadota bacterium]
MTDAESVTAVRWRWLALSALVVAADQLSKACVQAALAPAARVDVTPFFSWVHVHNTGAAFSLLADAGGWQLGFFVVVTLVVSVGLVIWLWRLPAGHWWTASALALILGGAWGNLWDRVALGHVVDFLLFHWRGAAFPAFNLADTAITIGAAMLIFEPMVRRGSGAQADV